MLKVPAALGESHSGLYLRFLNNLVNDSIYLLDEAIKMLPSIKEKEAAAEAQAQAADPAHFVSLQRLTCASHSSRMHAGNPPDQP
jgi:hypothetical protein